MYFRLCAPKKHVFTFDNLPKRGSRDTLMPAPSPQFFGMEFHQYIFTFDNLSKSGSGDTLMPAPSPQFFGMELHQVSNFVRV